MKEHEPFPPVQGYLDRSPEDLFNNEFKHHERLTRIVTAACGLLIAHCYVDPDELAAYGAIPEPVIQAGTHDGISDIPVMSSIALASGRKPIRMISKPENFYDPEGSALKGTLMQAGGWLNRHLGAYPTVRDENVNMAWWKSVRANAAYVLEVEEKDQGIFPTGSRRSDQVKSGALRLAAATDAPVVMIGISGTENDLKRLIKTGKRPRVAVAIGEPKRYGKRDVAALQAEHDLQKHRAEELHERVYGAAA